MSGDLGIWTVDDPEEINVGEGRTGAGLPPELTGCDLDGLMNKALLGPSSPPPIIALSISFANPADDPPVLVLVRLFILNSSESRWLSVPGSGASPLRLVVRIFEAGTAVPLVKTRDMRGEERPSSFLSASAVPSSTDAAVSMSTPWSSRSLVCRKIDAAMREGDE